MNQIKMRHVVLLAVLLFGCQIYAQQGTPLNVKVVKSKGKASIIKIPDNYPGELKPGSYTLVSTSDTELGITEESRGNSISFSFETDISKQVTKTSLADVSTDIKSMTTNFFYGWNAKVFEYGPFLSYSFKTAGASDSKTMSGGLFADWNILANNGENNWVPGVRLLAGIGQVDNSALKEAYSSDLMQAGFILKYFHFQSSFAVTGEIAMKIENYKPTGSEVKTTSQIARIGIINYF